MSISEKPGEESDDDLRLIEESEGVQVFELVEPWETENLRTPRSICREELFPASYLFKPRDTTFRDALDKEVQTRLEQTQYRENLATLGLKTLIGEQDREAYIDTNGVLHASNFTSEIPFLPQLKPLGPKKSLVMMTGYKLPGEKFVNLSVESSSTSDPKPPPTKRRGRPPTKTKRKLEQFVSNPFLDLRQYHNRFLYAKAMLHPYLETYKFHDVGKILSALWNDYCRSRASDYFTYLTLCTNICPTAIQQVRAYVNVTDTPDTKTEGRNCIEEIAALVQKQKQEVDALVESENIKAGTHQSNPRGSTEQLNSSSSTAHKRKATSDFHYDDTIVDGLTIDEDFHLTNVDFTESATALEDLLLIKNH